MACLHILHAPIHAPYTTVLDNPQHLLRPTSLDLGRASDPHHVHTRGIMRVAVVLV